MPCELGKYDVRRAPMLDYEMPEYEAAEACAQVSERSLA